MKNGSVLTNIPQHTSRDHVIDTKGKQLLTLCQTTSHIIGKGRLHSNNGIGDCTYHAHNGASTADYLILGAHDLDNITEFAIMEKNEECRI